MEVRAVAKFVKVQPRKVRLVANEVRGKNALHAANLLRFHPSKGAFVLHKVLMSAIANAEANNNLDAGSLKICEIRVDEGPVLKRIQARAMGRANRILKRMSHITVVVEDVEAVAVPKAHGTASKPRPILAVKTKGGKKAVKAEAAPAAEVEEVKEEVVEEVTAETPAEEVVEETVEETTAEATEETAEETPAAEGEEKN